MSPEIDGRTTGNGSFALPTVQLHVESCGTAGSCGGGLQAYPAWIPEAFEAGLGSPMRSIPKTNSSSNQARFSFARVVLLPFCWGLFGIVKTPSRTK